MKAPPGNKATHLARYRESTDKSSKFFVMGSTELDSSLDFLVCVATFIDYSCTVRIKIIALTRKINEWYVFCHVRVSQHGTVYGPCQSAQQISGIEYVDSQCQAKLFMKIHKWCPNHVCCTLYFMEKKTMWQHVMMSIKHFCTAVLKSFCLVHRAGKILAEFASLFAMTAQQPSHWFAMSVSLKCND